MPRKDGGSEVQRNPISRFNEDCGDQKTPDWMDRWFRSVKPQREAFARLLLNDLRIRRFVAHYFCLILFTVTPRRSTWNGNTVPPAFAIAASTRGFASGCVKKITQPPPPAPQTFAAIPPFLREASIRRSISGVVMPGAFVLRSFHSSCSSRPTPSQ